MSRLQDMSESFKLQYEKFLNGCDALEANGDWNVSTDGDMETYYFNDIICIIMMLISADGEFSDVEARYINDIFGFSYSAEELKELYKTNGDDIINMMETEIPAGYRRRKLINSRLAEHYKEMILQICDIIAESDGVIRVSETNEIEKIKMCLNNSN